MVLPILGYVSLAIVLFLLFLVLFEPGLRYEVTAPPLPLDSEEFLCLMAALADAQLHGGNSVEVLNGGEVFYEAELEAIRSARHSIHIEAFLFTPGAITDRFVEVLTERARAGVKVRLVLDALGCFHTADRYFEGLRAAGGYVSWYQPFRWYTFKRYNNRTHRELIIVDGRTGFIGGAGISPHWLGGMKGERPWHDMMCRVRGPLVSGLQTTFAENWLEASSEILSEPREFPRCTGSDEHQSTGHVRGMVIISTPSAARSTRARIVFQTLLASAKESILINSPYFLPDRSARKELIGAAGRGVKVVVVTPGEANNHKLTRKASRRHYGQLIQGGVQIFEYQPEMIHKKSMVVDGVWSVVGSTNFDTRSFGLNDEVNLAALDRELAARLTADFEHERGQSRQISYEEWRRRPITEKILGLIGRVVERQE